MDPSEWPDIEVANMFGAARSFIRHYKNQNRKMRFAFITEALATKGFLHSVEEVEKAYNFHLQLNRKKRRQENGHNRTKKGTESSDTGKKGLSGGKKSESSDVDSVATEQTKHVNGEGNKQTSSEEKSTVKFKNNITNLTNVSIKVSQGKTDKVGIDKNLISNNNTLCLNSVGANKGPPEIIQSEIKEVTTNISRESLNNPLPKIDIINEKETRIKKQISGMTVGKKEVKSVLDTNVNKKRIKTTLNETDEIKLNECIPDKNASNVRSKSDQQSICTRTDGCGPDIDKTSATSESVKQSNYSKCRKSTDISNETAIKSLTKKTNDTKIDGCAPDIDKTSATSELVKQSNCSEVTKSSNISNKTSVKSLRKRSSDLKIDKQVLNIDKTSVAPESVKQSLNCTKRRISSEISNESAIKSLTKKINDTKIDKQVLNINKTSATSESVKLSNCSEGIKSSDISNQTAIKSLRNKTSDTKIDDCAQDVAQTSVTSQSVKQSLHCTKRRKFSDISNESVIKSLTKKTNDAKVDELASDIDKTAVTPESVKQSSNYIKHRKSSDISNQTAIKSLRNKTSDIKIDDHAQDIDKTSATSESVKQSNCSEVTKSSVISNQTAITSLTKKTNVTRVDGRGPDIDKTSATSESVKQSNYSKCRKSTVISNQTAIKSLTKKTNDTKIDGHAPDIDKTSATSESVKQSNCSEVTKSSDISNQTAVKSLRKTSNDLKIDEHALEIDKTLITSKSVKISSQRSVKYITNKKAIEDLVGTKINIRTLDHNTISVIPESVEQSGITVNSVDSTNNNNIFVVNNKSIKQDQDLLNYLKIMPSKTKTNDCGGKRLKKSYKNNCNILKDSKDKKGERSKDENVNTSKVPKIVHDKTSMKVNDPEVNRVQATDSEISITTSKEIPNTPTEVTRQNSQDHQQQINNESVLISEQQFLNTKQVESIKYAEPGPSIEETSKKKSRVGLKAFPCGCQNICRCNFINLNNKIRVVKDAFQSRDSVDKTVSTTKGNYTNGLSAFKTNDDLRPGANVCIGKKRKIEEQHVKVKITRPKRHKHCLCNEKVCICHFKQLPTSPLHLRSTRSTSSNITVTLVESPPAQCKTSTPQQHNLKNVPTVCADNPEVLNPVNGHPKPKHQISEGRRAYLRQRQSRNQRLRRQRKAEMARMANAAYYYSEGNPETLNVPYYNFPYTYQNYRYLKAVPEHHRPFIRIKDFARENNFRRGKYDNKCGDSSHPRHDTLGNDLDQSEELVLHDFNSSTNPLVECSTPSRGTDYYGEGEEERKLEDIDMRLMSPRVEENKPSCSMPILNFDSNEKSLESHQSPPRCNTEEIQQLVQIKDNIRIVTQRRVTRHSRGSSSRDDRNYNEYNGIRQSSGDPDVPSKPSSSSCQEAETVNNRWNDTKEFKTNDIVDMYRNPSPPLSPNTVLPPSPSPAVAALSDPVTTDTTAVPSPAATSSRPSTQVVRQLKRKKTASRMKHFEKLLTTVAKNQMKFCRSLKKMAVLGERVAELSNDITIVKKSILDLKETGL